MPTENRFSNTEMVSVPFHREDRYIVVKRSDLAKVPVAYRSALVDPLFHLQAHLPQRECLVIESDWPESEPTWAAIQARVTGQPALQPHAEPIAWMVGTAIWWTKEEAERDAAATGLPIIAVGPITDTASPPVECSHEWTDDGEFLLVCTACGTQENHDPKWRDMASAPRDGTLVRLLVEFTEHATEDSESMPSPTIGANSYDHTGEDVWQFAGWSWEQDRFTQGAGDPIAWLPLLDTPHTDPCVVERLRSAIEQQKNLIASLRAELVESRSIDASAEPSAAAESIPEGYCIMPRRLTAENGAKALLLGEFKLEVTRECPECLELDEPVEGCEICDGEGEYAQRYTIPWEQIKFIYSEAVKGLALQPSVTCKPS